jgi:amino acid adenylation domain-containing protein
MSLLSKLNELAAKGVAVSLVADKLTVHAAPGVLTADELAWLKTEKTQICQSYLNWSVSSNQQIAPLSSAQQSLWLIDRIEGQSRHYHMPMALAIEGPLQPQALQQACCQLIERQQILRTVYRTDEAEQPWQLVQTHFIFKLAETDGSAWPAPAAALAELSQQHANEPFDLATDLMLKARLVRLAATQHVLLLNLHHIAADGWSLRILMQELGQFYQAAVAGESIQLQPLPLQYLDYANWQQQQLQGAAWQRLQSYWLTQLQDLPLVHQLPLDYPRPEVTDFTGQQLTLLAPPALLQQLQQLARQQQVTLFMLLETAFCVLLQRWSGNQEQVLGTTSANREQAQVGGLIGYFVNTLVLRHQVEPALAFTQLLQQHKQVILDAFAHQQMPFERLVEKLQPQRQNFNPLFQIMFSLDTLEQASQTFAQTRLQLLPDQQPLAKFDLSLSTAESQAGLQMRWDYASRLFAAASVQQMAQSYLQLLQSIVAQPELPISRLSMCSPAQQLLLQQLNPRWQPELQQAPELLTLFEHYASQQPDSAALQIGQASYSFAALNAEANRLARFLQSQGVTAGQRVGIFLTRQLNLISSILALWKLGAAYVPLEPAMPDERLAAIIADSSLNLLLTETAFHSRLQQVGPTRCVLDAATSDWRRYSAENLPAPAAGSLAYLMYTSGSTGTPKGVLIGQSQLASYRAAAVQLYQLAEQSDWRLLAGNAFSFDAFVEELVLTLAAGHCLVLNPQGLALTARQYLQLLQSEQIQLISLPTSYWHYLTEELDAGLAQQLKASLQLVITGGEAMTASHLARWQQLFGVDGPVLWNTYGPTEGTVIASAMRVDQWQGMAGQWPPVGQGLANSQLLLLSAEGEVLPPGAAGELCIAGPALAAGYLNKAAETASRFCLVQPLPAGPQLRVYRTGDKARFGADQQLHFLGRLDSQVKIRGFRVELTEVETQLLQLPDIRNVAVAVQPDPAGQPSLLAWVTLQDTAQTAVAPLQRQQAWLDQLRLQLPDYMLPRSIQVLAQLPLTTNGKIDKKALPPPDWTAWQAEYVAPADATEQRLQQIWAQLLHLEVAALSMTADFFRVGGHSLLATRLASAIQQEWQVEMPLRLIFSHSRLEQLAAWLKQQTAQPLTQIPLADRSQPLPLSFAQQTLWFVDQLNGGSPHYNMPLAVRMQGELRLALLQQAVDYLLQRQEILRTCYFNDAQGIARQQLLPAAQLPLQLLQSGPLSAAQLQQMLSELSAYRFDLKNEIPIRIHLIKQSPTEHVLLLVIHHIACDGWSIGVLTQELMQAYQALLQGQLPDLPALAVQYADFAAWQQQQDGLWQQQLAYWQTQLQGGPQLHSLPLDFARPSQQSHQGQIIRQQLPAELAATLQQLAQSQQLTRYMLFVAMFSLLLSRWSYQQDIVVGCPVAGRRRSELEPLVGYFINILPIRTQLDEQQPIMAYLAQVRHNILQAYEHQDLSFDRLVELLQPERSLSYAPLVQILFAEQNTETVEFSLPGLQISGIHSGYSAIKYDLNVSLLDEEGALVLYWNAATALFSRDSIQRLSDSFALLLHSLSQTVLSAPLQQLQLTLAEPAPLSGADWPEQQPLLWQQLARQAQLQPDKPAVLGVDQQLSFRQLLAQSQQLAELLHQYGVVPAQPVAVCLPRSVAAVTAFLALQYLGAVYVPLDPVSPPDRIRYILQDSGCALLLTLQHYAAQLPDYQGRCYCLDAEPSDSASVLTLLPAYHWPDRQQSSYVLYTSGTTGWPKGTVVTQANLQHFLTSFQSQLAALAQPEIWLQTSSLAFDAAMTGYALLTQGRSLVLASDEQVRDPAALLACLRQYRADTVKATLSLALTLLPALEAASDLAVNLVVAGENVNALNWQRLRQYAQSRQVQVLNAYGPTETTVNVSFAAVTDSAQPNIGFLMPNCQAFVLDRQQNPLPAGAVGELYLGGACVTAGYLHKPELTAQAFLTLPFAAAAGRLYRTGDLVRLTAQGELVFIARVDQQIKLRGYRIELGEISSKIADLTDVSNVYLTLFEHQQQQHLVAYVQSELPAAVLESGIRSQLLQSLPEYMVPAVIICLPQFPLTANGKLDVRALPAPTFGDLAFVPPQTAVEQQLALLWQQLLALPDSIGRQAHFFRLGGHSLLVTRLNNAIHQQFGLELPLRVIFENPELAALAALIDTELVAQHNNAQLSQGQEDAQLLAVEW